MFTNPQPSNVIAYAPGGKGMTQQFLAISLAFSFSVFAIGAPPQTVASDDLSATPVLRLRVTLNKESYAVKKSVLTNTTFTNLSDTVLCFPKPEQGRQVPAQGYLAIQVARPPSAKESDSIYFLEHIDRRGTWSRQKLLLEIQRDWIKLSPNETYTTASAQITATFDVPGQWRLTEKYLPPRGSFGGDAYRKYLASAAKSVGCTLPVSEVSAETVTINIVEPEK
jgi:hypothetical protein